jgi:LPXTG-motif cell wall-anchored protein
MPAPPSRATWEWEPQLAIDGRGVLWAVGGHCPFIDQYGPCGAPTEGPGRADILAVWRSDNGGRSWRFVADPLATPGALGAATDTPGSSDPDIAVTPVARPGKPPILATVSLFGASSTLAVSPDDGRSWAVIPAVGVPGQDRPWLAASGTCDLFLEYDPIVDLAGAATVPRVERYNACTIAAAAPGITSALPEVSQTVEPLSNAITKGNQLPGRLSAGRDGLYASYLSCDAASACTLGVARSRDNAATWTDETPRTPTVTIATDPTFPISASADMYGGVAIAVTDRHHVYVWASTDGGATWPIAKRPVDSSLGWSMANVPSVAVRGNEIVAAWFGSPPSSRSQSWQLVVARSSDHGATWRDDPLGPVLATTAHATPLGPGLYDDFGSAITATADDVIVYTQSCQGHSPSDPDCPGPPPGVTGTYDVTRYAWVAATTAVPAPTTPPPPSANPAAVAPNGASRGNLPATGGTTVWPTALPVGFLIGSLLIRRRRRQRFGAV